MLEEIAEQALVVRKLQKEYFRTRKPDVLEQSKAEEKKLDEMLAKWKDNQKELF